MIGYDTLRIHCPYSLKSITSLELDWRPNAHATLKVCGIIDDHHQDNAVSQAVPSDVLEITIDTDNGTQTLFKGDMLSVQSNFHQGVYTLELEAISGTNRLDREKKTRSFQDTGMTYEAVIKEVLSDYPGSGVIHTTGSSTLIGEPLIQYEESDWAFIQRLASHLHTVVVPDLFEASPRIYVGMPTRNTAAFQINTHYTFQRDFQSYRQAQIDQPELTLSDFDRYQIQSGDHYLLGDPLNIQGERWIIQGVTAQLVQGQLTYTYQLGKNSGIRQGRILHLEMVGASLQGKILDVKGQRVKLHLDVDDKQDMEKAHWFPFAPPTGNMMYLMPQKGSTGTLYFPSDRGGQAIVTGCVRQNGSNCGKTSQPENRYLGTEHGSELEMTPTAMNLKSGSPAPLQISFDDATGIILTSHRKLKLEAKEDISLFTPKKIRIQTTNLIYAKKLGKQSGFAIESEFHILGDEVHATGTERQSYPKYNDEPATWTKKEEEEDEGGFSWGKLFGAVVAVVAVVVVVAVVASFAVATGGIGGAILMGAAIGALGAVAGKIGSDIANGEISSGGEYLRSALIGGAIGAVTGAIFGPFGGATTSLLPQTTSQLMIEAATTMWIGGASSSIDFVATEVFINGRVPTYGEAAQAFMYGTIFTGAFMAFAPVAGFIRKAFQSKPKLVPTGSSPNAQNPMFGDDWNQYFKSEYGAENVKWESEWKGRFNELLKTKTNKGMEIQFINPAGHKIEWVEQNPKNIPNAIAAASESSNSGKKIEGIVGGYVQEKTDVLGFGLEMKNITTRKPAGDIDVLTKNQIIEVKKSIGAVKMEQIDKYTNPNHINFFNYEQQEIVIYVYERFDPLNPDIKKVIDQLKSKGVQIVNSKEELWRILK